MRAGSFFASEWDTGRGNKNVFLPDDRIFVYSYIGQVFTLRVLSYPRSPHALRPLCFDACMLGL